MPNRRSGHIVQIWRPVGDRRTVQFVDVEGRSVATTVSREWFDQWEWTSMSRELDLRRAKRFAKAYARAGFPTRVIRQSAFLVNRVIVLELKPARKAVRR